MNYLFLGITFLALLFTQICVFIHDGKFVRQMKTSAYEVETSELMVRAVKHQALPVNDRATAFIADHRELISRMSADDANEQYQQSLQHYGEEYREIAPQTWFFKISKEPKAYYSLGME